MKGKWARDLKASITNTISAVGIFTLVTASCLLAAPAAAWASASTTADAVKELKVENAALEAKDKDLEDRIAKLETAMKAQQKQIDELAHKGGVLQVPMFDGIVGASQNGAKSKQSPPAPRPAASP